MMDKTKENIIASNKKTLKLVLACMLIALLAYNGAIFFTFGISGHNTVFWFSYAITLVGALSVAASLMLLGPFRAFLRDWLFGFPIVRYGAIYCVMQYTASVTFMKSETAIKPAIVYPVQILLLSAYLILAIMCFLAKDSIKQTEQVNIDKTSFMKKLRADLASLCAQADNEDIRKALAELADEAKYSDPVSSDKLAEIEKRLSDEVERCRYELESNNAEKAVQHCLAAKRVLQDRNELCKIFKRDT